MELRFNKDLGQIQSKELHTRNENKSYTSVTPFVIIECGIL